MKELPCAGCGLLTGVGEFCSHCQQEMYIFHEYRRAMRNGRLRESPTSRLKRIQREQEAERLRREEYEKQRRVDQAVEKECAGCGQQKPHDRDDYLCIVCRDGEQALPKLPKGIGYTAA